MAMNRGWGTPGDNRSLAHWWVDNDEPTKIYLQSLCGQYKLEYAESQEVWFKQDHPKCAACELAREQDMRDGVVHDCLRTSCRALGYICPERQAGKPCRDSPFDTLIRPAEVA